MRVANELELRERGSRYETFVYDLVLRDYNVQVKPCRTYEEQMSIGENHSGLEVKCQERCREFGSLAIEYAETTGNGRWVPSGIMREDNSKHLATGDWETVWVFTIPILREIRPIMRAYMTLTSKGYILPLDEAERLCTAKLIP